MEDNSNRSIEINQISENDIVVISSEDNHDYGLPREVLQAVYSDWSSNSSGRTISENLQWWKDYDVRRYDNLMTEEVRSTRLVFQAAIQGLGNHIEDYLE